MHESWLGFAPRDRHRDRVNDQRRLEIVAQIGEKTPTGGDVYARRPDEKRVVLVSSFIDDTSDPLSQYSPADGVSRHPMMFIRVLLPAPFSPTTPSTGHMRAMWSHQPAGPPVTGTTLRPAAISDSTAPSASEVSRPCVVMVSSANSPQLQQVKPINTVAVRY